MSFTLNRPETIEDARKIRYNKSAINPSGIPYRDGYCAESVAERGRAIRFWQCQRKAVVGIWCRQHSPEEVAKRDAASDARFRRHMNNLPGVRAARYREALEKIVNRPAETPVRDVAFMRKVALEALEG